MRKIIEKLTGLSDRVIVTGLFLASLLIRLLYSFYAYSKDIMDSFADDKGYFYLAREIVSRGKVFYDKDIHLYAEMVGPGLPWINALTLWVFGKNWLPVFIVTSFCSALVTYFIYKTARLVLDKPTAIIAGLWSCIYFFYINFSATAGKEILMSLCLAAIVYLLLKLFYLKKFNWPEFLILTVVFTYSFHLDERFLIFSPLIFIYILLEETEFFKQVKLKKTLMFFILVVMLTVPWTIRNYKEFGKVVLISTRTESYTDRILGYERKEHVIDKYNDIYGFYYIHDYQVDSIISGLKTRTDGGYLISEEQRRAMKNGNLPKPLTGIKAFWIRTKDMLRPFQVGGEFQRSGYFFYQKSLRHNLVSFAFYGIMFFLSLPGFYFMYRKNKHVFYFFLITILVYTLLHGLLIPYTNWRYRLPLDSIFIIVGSLGLIRLFEFRLIKIFGLNIEFTNE
jgi:hypothetical protein